MGCLNDRSRIATFFEKLAHFFRFARKIRVITAQIPFPILNFLDSDVCSISVRWSIYIINSVDKPNFRVYPESEPYFWIEEKENE